MRQFPVRASFKARRQTLLVRRSPLDRTRGVLQFGQIRLPCALGRAGTSIFKREGDGATPVAAMRLLSAYRNGLASPGRTSRLPARHTRDSDGWCDANGDPAYNRPVRLPFRASAETMKRSDGLYDFVVVLDWNVSSRARGRGSAIFLHLARAGYKPTEGCVALSRGAMRRLAPHLGRDCILRVER